MPSSQSSSAEPGTGAADRVGASSTDTTLRRRFVETARRAEIVGLVNAARTELDLGRSFSEELCEVFDAEIAFVLEASAGGHRSRPVAAVGISEQVAAELLSVRSSARAIEAGRATVISGDDALGIGARTAILSPFRTESGRAALVGVARLYKREFDEQDRSLVEAVTLAVGHAFERIWAYEERDRRAEEQNALVRAAKSLGGSLETPQVLEALCAEVRRALKSEAVVACLGDEVDGYVATGIAGVPESFRGFRQPPGTGLGGAAITADRTQVTLDYKGEGHRPPETTAFDRIVCSLATPIRWEGRSRGFLSAGFERQRRIDPNDIELLEGFAELAGQACANAERHTAVRAAAEIDGLTGCLNRAALNRRLGELLAEADSGNEPISVALLDLDGFKSINDVYGHVEGDSVLRRVGATMRSSVRVGDLACRYGGDEFALILPGTRQDKASPVLDRVRAAIRSMDVPGGRLTACVGLAERDQGETQSELIGRADEALREAKGSPSPGSMRRASRRGAMAMAAAAADEAGPDPDRRQRWRAVAGDIGLGIARQPDADAGAAVVATELSELLGLDVCAVLRLDSAGELEAVAAVGPDRPPSEWLDIEGETVGRALREKRSILGNEDTGRSPDDPSVRPTSRQIGVPLVIEGRPWGVIAVRAGARHLDQIDAELMEAVAEHLSAAIRAGDLYEQLTESMIGTAEALAAALEAKDSYTADHARSIADLAVDVGRQLELPESAIDDLRYGAIFHDVGKIAVPDALINKPGPLSEEEFELIKKHPITGAEILAPVPFLYGVRTIVRHAHEHWDGGGYPDGLEGAQIPLGARIVLAVDAYHAMTSDRPYRKAMSEQEARAQLAREAGKQFDPEVTEALLKVLRRR